MHSRIWTSLVALALLSVSACGSGGSGGGPMPGAASFNLAAGLANLSGSTVTANLTISGTVNGFEITAGSGQLSQSAAVAATFSGAPASAQTTMLSGTVSTSEFSNLVESFSIVQYDSSTYALLGLDTNYAVPQYVVADSPLEFPSTVVAGDTGAIGIMEVYDDSLLKDFAGALNINYAVHVNSGSPDSVVVELTEQYVDPRNVPGQVFQYDYLLTAAGDMSLLSLTVTYPESPGIPMDTLFLSVQP